jgi:acetyl esterase/lipase
LQGLRPILKQVYPLELPSPKYASAAGHAAPLSLDAYMALDGPPPAARFSYGTAPSQYTELFLPQGSGPFPVVVLVHGGCWTAEYGGMRQMRDIAGALTGCGIAVWNVEYRRIDEPGGGYPGMYLDLIAAVDLLVSTASQPRPAQDGLAQCSLDLRRVAAVGHSAGGQLVQWLAGRSLIAPSSPLHRPAGSYLEIRQIVSLGGLADLRDTALLECSCGRTVAELAGQPGPGRPDVLSDTNAAQLMPNGSKTVLVTGELDAISPPAVAEAYAALAAAAGDDVRVLIVPGAGHYDEVASGTACWETVLEAIGQALAAPSAVLPG